MVPSRVLALALLAANLAAAAPDCLPRAAAAALADLGDPIGPRRITAALPMHRDGVDVFDLHQWLRSRGVQTRALAPDTEALTKLGRAGAALILVRGEGGQAHAVYARAAPDPAMATIQDPRAAAAYRQPWPAALAGLRVALWLERDGQGHGDALGADAQHAIERTDAAFVATGWLRRAAGLPFAAYDDRLALIGHAVDADPCLPAVRWTALIALASTPPSTQRTSRVLGWRMWCRG